MWNPAKCNVKISAVLGVGRRKRVPRLMKFRKYSVPEIHKESLLAYQITQDIT